MTLVRIAAALQVRLATIAPALDTVVENVATYVPLSGRPYQRVFLLPGAPDNPTMGDGFYREQGLFQVTLCYPAGQGAGAALARAELVRDAFARGLQLAAGTATVRIDATPAIAAALIDGDRYCIPVRMRWSADVYR